MKKFILFATIFLVAVIITGCKDPELSHEHTFADSWSKNDTHHWKVATCEHEVVDGKAAHTFGEWTTTKEATEEAVGIQERVCIVCNYNETAEIAQLEHTHKFAADWTYDVTHHWKAATCEHTEEVIEKSAHSYGNWTTTKEATEEAVGSKERVCSVCNYTEIAEIAQLEHTHKFAADWTYDVTHHWKIATCEHTSEVTDFGEHSFEWKITKNPTETETGEKKEICLVCGYENSVVSLEPILLGIWEKTWGDGRYGESWEFKANKEVVYSYTVNGVVSSITTYDWVVDGDVITMSLNGIDQLSYKYEVTGNKLKLYYVDDLYFQYTKK